VPLPQSTTLLPRMLAKLNGPVGVLVPIPTLPWAIEGCTGIKNNPQKSGENSFSIFKIFIQQDFISENYNFPGKVISCKRVKNNWKNLIATGATLFPGKTKHVNQLKRK
jgi:hypothetical protein